MLHLKKIPNHTWIVQWVPKKTVEGHERVWKVEILKDGKIVHTLEDTSLGRLQEAVNRLSSHLE